MERQETTLRRSLVKVDFRSNVIQWSAGGCTRRCVQLSTKAQYLRNEEVREKGWGIDVGEIKNN
jgi:hypothetical protein